MKILARFKIRTKLFLLSAIFIFAIMILGALGFYYLNQSTKNLENIYQRHMKLIEQLDDIRVQTRANEVAVLSLIIAETQDQKDAAQKEYQTRMDNIQKDIEAIAKYPLSSTEQGYFTSLQTEFASWKTITETIIEKVNAKEQASAVDYFYSDGQTVFETMQTDIRSMGAEQMKSTDTIYNRNESSNKHAVMAMLWVAIIFSVLGIVLAFLIVYSISRGIRKIVKLIKTTSELNLVYDNSFDHMLDYQDEIGEITRSVGEMRQALRDIFMGISAISKDLANNSNTLAKQTEENMKAIQQTTTSIGEIAQGNTSSANEITKATASISDIYGTVVHVNELAQATEQKAKESTNLVVSGQEALDTNVEKTQESVHISDSVGKTIDELSETMLKVTDIVDVIRKISAQTNLLALNASIEAARAGEAGKGFAVVATEIGALAKTTNASVEDIVAIIQEAVSKNNQSSEKVHKIQEIITEQGSSSKTMKESFLKVEDSVIKMAKQAQVISGKVVEIMDATQSMTNQMTDMSAIAEETAAESEEISATTQEQMSNMELLGTITEELADMAEKLDEEIHKFKV